MPNHKCAMEYLITGLAVRTDSDPGQEGFWDRDEGLPTAWAAGDTLWEALSVRMPPVLAARAAQAEPARLRADKKAGALPNAALTARRF